mmetsp:Transcript_35645/g.34678  ORF Transcript_35645/g.34678 Transcript_35645/m.34678 type:complete len:84 (+) Transcript_35645:1050-1301(+)
MYKDILDNQISFNQQMLKNFGNMTSVEKKLNKGDLIAYKNFDNRQYSLVPGYNTRNAGINNMKQTYSKINPEYEPAYDIEALS